MSGALSVSHALHESLHHDGAANSHFCLVCLFAKGQVNAAEVALEMGNSPQMIFQHYKELVQPEAAKAWFAIVPKE